jgi:hypothetical protein
MKRLIRLIFFIILFFSIGFSLPKNLVGEVLAGGCNGTLVLCTGCNCITDPGGATFCYDSYTCVGTGTGFTCGPGTHACPNSSNMCCDNVTGNPDAGYDVCRPQCPTPITPANNAVLASANSIDFSWAYAWTYDSHSGSGGYYWCRYTGSGDYPRNSYSLNLNKLFPGPNNTTYSQLIGTSSVAAAYPSDPPTSYTFPLNAGYNKILTYDDRSLSYSGSWQPVSDANFISGTGTATSQNGAKATLGFDGEGIVLNYWKRPTGGRMKVTIDGDSANASYIDQAANRDKYAWQNFWTSPELTDGPHSVSIHPPASYWEDVTLDAIVAGNTVYDVSYGQSDPVTFSCIWSTCWWFGYDTRAYGGSYWYGRRDFPATFNFTGKQLSIMFNQKAVSTETVNGYVNPVVPGVMTVNIDGTDYSFNQNLIPDSMVANNETDYFAYYQEWKSPTLANGHHTVTFEHADPVPKWVGIDAVSVTNSSAPSVEGNYSWTVSATGGNDGYGSLNCPVNNFTIGKAELELKNLVLKNQSGVVVNPGSGGSNNVCTDFPQGRITFDTTLTSLAGGGGGEISKVYVALYQGGVQKMAAMAEGLDTGNITQTISGSGAAYWGRVTTSVNGNDRLVSFPVAFASYTPGTYEVKVYGFINKGLWMSAVPPRFLVFSACSLAWWQVKDSDIQSSGDLASAVYTNDYFDLPGSGGFPGIPAYAGTTNLTGADVSPVGWLVKNTPMGVRTYDYAYFANQIPADITAIMNSVDTTNVPGSFTSGSAVHDTNDYYWYKYDGALNGNQALTIPATDIGTRKVILMVDNADVNITGNINLTRGQGFFMLVVKGNINVDALVGGGVSPNLEGLYLADGTFSDGVGDAQLWVRGSVSGNLGVNMQRDLGNVANNAPSEFFEYAPDQIMLFPKVFGYRRINWKEVAP